MKKKIMSLTLNIDVIKILKENQLKCLFNDFIELKKWDIRFKTLFKIIFISLKYFIKNNIERMIDVKIKNDAKIWMTVEKIYKSFIAILKDSLMKQFININLNDYKKDANKYIIDFRKLINKIEMYDVISSWIVFVKFILDLKDYQVDFIEFERDRMRDVFKKKKLYHLNLNNLMTQITSRALNWHLSLIQLRKK